MFSTQKFLSSLAKRQFKRLLYYPSAGNRHGFVTDFNADVIVFSDFRPKSLRTRRSFWRQFRQGAQHEIRLIVATPIARVFQIDRRKWGVFLFMDNNEAVRLIHKSGLRISTFIGVCDGCAEGGNYECVNEMPFFGKILDLMPETGMNYITDHSPYVLDGWERPRNVDNSFVLKNNGYKTSLMNDSVPGFRNRAYEFTIKKQYMMNEVKDPVPHPR